MMALVRDTINTINTLLDAEDLSEASKDSGVDPTQ